MRNPYKVLQEAYEQISEAEQNPKARQKYYTAYWAVRKANIAAAAKEGNWRPWVERLVIEKSKPSNRWLFEVTVEDIMKVWPVDNMCPVLRIPFKYYEDVATYKPNLPSIDRFDPNINYTPDNIRVISTRANTIKYNGTADELRKIAQWMRTNNATPENV